jgi:hypothetical protein
LDGLKTIDDPLVFLGLSALLVGYLLYTMIRKRKGERPGEGDREPIL